MNVPAGRLLTLDSRWIPAMAVDRRLARAVVATLVIGGYMALGFAFRLSAEGYLLVGIPITVAFQVLVVRRPLRALWLRGTPAMTFTPRSIVAVVVVAIAPAVILIRGVRDGDPVLAAYGLAAIVGAVGAVYAMRAMDRDAIRSTIRTTLNRAIEGFGHASAHGSSGGLETSGKAESLGGEELRDLGEGVGARRVDDLRSQCTRKEIEARGHALPARGRHRCLRRDAPGGIRWGDGHEII